MKQKFSIYTYFQERPLSWSSLSSFAWSKEEWYQKYILGIKSPENAEMRFGKKEGERIAKDSSYMPYVPRLAVSEHPFNVMLGNIKMIGFGDFFCDVSRKKLLELKTGVKKWDQTRANSHGQIDMYLLMHFITEKIRPEDMDVKLVWLPTKRSEGGDFDVSIEYVDDIEHNMKVFKTKRTMSQILKFGAYVKSTAKEMEEYVNSFK